jgi:hypothetical protein
MPPYSRGFSMPRETNPATMKQRGSGQPIVRLGAEHGGEWQGMELRDTFPGTSRL